MTARSSASAIRLAAVAALLALVLPAGAQVGDHRNDLQVGVNGGYILSNLGFVPKVSQGFHGGMTGGLSVKYVSEKYFSMICSIYGEVNYSVVGWKESILDAQDQPVVNPRTQLAEQFSKDITYIQVPLMAHLAWGKERKGAQFFFQVGPQFGFHLGEKAFSNFDVAQANMADRANQVIAQDTMAVENKFDYGITAGLGVEYSIPKAGHLLLEGRYYYGLGNIYGDTKRDYFARSNYGNIIVKLTWLFDIIKTKQ